MTHTMPQDQQERLAHLSQTVDWGGLEDFRASLPPYHQHEVFRLFMYGWDIVRLSYLLHLYPREAYSLDVALFARSYGFPFNEGGQPQGDLPQDSGFFYVNTTLVMRDEIDHSRPLYVALVQFSERDRPGAVLLDGLHRLYKAAWQGIPTLSAYLFTQREEQLCRL